MRICKIKALLLALLVMGGCSSYIVERQLGYQPNSLEKGKGSITLGEFKYTPASQGAVQPNQIKTTDGFMGFWAIDDSKIYLTTPVAEHVRWGISEELQYTGFSVGEGNIELTCEIQEFSVNKVFFPPQGVNIILSLNYTLNDKSSGKVLFEDSVTIKRDARIADIFSFSNTYVPPSGLASGSVVGLKDKNALNSAIKHAFEEIVTNNKFISIIN